MCSRTHSLAIARQAVARLIPQRDTSVPEHEFWSGFRCPENPPGEPAGRPVSIEFFGLIRGLFGIPTPLRLGQSGAGAPHSKTLSRSGCTCAPPPGLGDAPPLRSFSGGGVKSSRKRSLSVIALRSQSPKRGGRPALQDAVATACLLAGVFTFSRCHDDL